MVNPKKAKLKAALERIPKKQLGDEDILSHDLSDKIGSWLSKDH